MSQMRVLFQHPAFRSVIRRPLIRSAPRAMSTIPGIETPASVHHVYPPMQGMHTGPIRQETQQGRSLSTAGQEQSLLEELVADVNNIRVASEQEGVYVA